MVFADYFLTSDTATGLAKEGPFGILVTLIIVFGVLVVILRWIDSKREIRRDEQRDQKFFDLKNEWIISNQSLAESLAALAQNIIKLEEILNGQREILRDINARLDRMEEVDADHEKLLSEHDQKLKGSATVATKKGAKKKNAV